MQPETLFHTGQHISVQTNGQLLTAIPTSMQAAGAPRLVRPIASQQANVGPKVQAGPRGLRGIAIRPQPSVETPTITAADGAPVSQQVPTTTPSAAVAPIPQTAKLEDAADAKLTVAVAPTVVHTSEQKGTDMRMPAPKPPVTASSPMQTHNTTPVASSAAVTPMGLEQAKERSQPPHASLPPVATVPPLELVSQPIAAAVPMTSLPDRSDGPQGNSMSPPIGAPFPEDVGPVPDTLEQASEILTHIIEGYVIRESSEPFPVSRSALLSEMIRREQASAALSKERKRKLENNSNVNRAPTALAPAITPAASKSVTTDDGISAPAGKTTVEKCNTVESTEAIQSQATATSAVGGTAAQPQTTQTVPENTAANETPTVEPKPSIADKPAEPNLPCNWSVQEVYDFIKSVPGCAAYADEFRSQDIDGEALLFLKSEHMSLMNVTIGAAARICARLNQLCGDRRKT